MFLRMRCVGWAKARERRAHRATTTPNGRLASLSPPYKTRMPRAKLSPLLRAHQLGKTLEQIVRVARAGRRLRMILHGKDRPVVERDAAIGAVEQRDMGLRRAFGQRRLVHRKTVVHRGDLDLAGGLVLDRVVGAVMPLMHLPGLGADGEAQHLVAEADAEGRRAGRD